MVSSLVSFEQSPALLTPVDESLKDAVVIMPIGGQATRAQEVTGGAIPKHLIALGDGQPVLDIVCRGLQAVGFRQFVFCVGQYKDQAKIHINSRSWITHQGVSFDFSEEKTPLGPDGAILKAIGVLGLHGLGLAAPGDMMLPWRGIAEMARGHTASGADVTVGVTSKVTTRTTDIGRIVAEEQSNRLIWCYPRSDDPGKALRGSQNLTSAAAMAFSVDRYTKLCEAYLCANPNQADKPLSFRDQVLPWAVRAPDFQLHAYDTKGEALDLGTPINIAYGQKNWRQYV